MTITKSISNKQMKTLSILNSYSHSHNFSSNNLNIPLKKILSKDNPSIIESKYAKNKQQNGDNLIT